MGTLGPLVLEELEEAVEGGIVVGRSLIEVVVVVVVWRDGFAGFCGWSVAGWELMRKWEGVVLVFCWSTERALLWLMCVRCVKEIFTRVGMRVVGMFDGGAWERVAKLSSCFTAAQPSSRFRLSAQANGRYCGSIATLTASTAFGAPIACRRGLLSLDCMRCSSRGGHLIHLEWAGESQQKDKLFTPLVRSLTPSETPHGTSHRITFDHHVRILPST